jgi:diguanylate cyclase (GGDEF)-like protein
LFMDGHVAGTLNVGRMGTAEAQFRADEYEVIRLFARQASIALQNAEAHQAIWNRAQTDEVTGLLNRGTFEQEMAELVANQGSRPLALLMLDLDMFKAFNDQYGHPAGDALLRGIAIAINGAVRASDRVYRYGGDEFAILLPETGAETALQVAGRIRSAVAGSDAVTGVPITASIGVVVQRRPGGTRDELVTAADAALYRAKGIGGGQVSLAGSGLAALAGPRLRGHRRAQPRARDGAA